MNLKRNKIIGLILAIAAPVVLTFFFKWYIEKQNLSREQNRPHSPGKMFASGVQETTDFDGEKSVDSVYHSIPNMKFETQSGDSLALDSLRGKIYIADFFFASCPGICPKMNHSLERVQQAFIKDGNFRLVSFTVDPERDTIDVLRRYANEHNAIPGKWYFLRQNRENIFRLASEGFFLTAKEDDGGGPEDFIHSEKLVMVDQQGNIRGYYSGVDSSTVNKLMADVVLLLRESEGRKSFGGGFKNKTKK
ncbi:MAG: SCO family protein [Bacteroidetes bacterium]|nr:SCO family protein [Bacteroidota bacterium]